MLSKLAKAARHRFGVLREAQGYSTERERIGRSRGVVSEETDSFISRMSRSKVWGHVEGRLDQRPRLTKMPNMTAVQAESENLVKRSEWVSD